MIMSSGLRKFALTLHIISSVGWFGAVAVFLALSVAGLISQDALVVRAAYLAMGLATWYAIVPLCLVSFLSGIVSSLGTEWGLFRYYWVVVKLVITAFATFVLAIHVQPILLLANEATQQAQFGTRLHNQQLLMVYASGAALAVLLALTALSIYKPRGMTVYGWRKQQERRVLPPAERAPG